MATKPNRRATAAALLRDAVNPNVQLTRYPADALRDRVTAWLHWASVPEVHKNWNREKWGPMPRVSGHMWQFPKGTPFSICARSGAIPPILAHPIAGGLKGNPIHDAPVHADLPAEPGDAYKPTCAITGRFETPDANCVAARRILEAALQSCRILDVEVSFHPEQEGICAVENDAFSYARPNRTARLYASR